MKDTQNKRSHTKRLRRIVRRIRIEVKNALHYYSVAIIAFLLTMALLAARFFLRHMGCRFTAKTDTFLLIAILILLLICMLGGLRGMILLSLTRKDEHVRERFLEKVRAEKTERGSDMPAELRSALRIEDSDGFGSDVVFLLLWLAFWTCGTWLLVRGLEGEIPSAIENSPLLLLITWFPSIRVTRLIRRGYERVLLWYRPRPLRTLNGKEKNADEQAQ